MRPHSVTQSAYGNDMLQILGRLTGKPLEAPKKEAAAPKKEKAAEREPQPQLMAVHGGEDKEIVGRSAAAIKARLMLKIDTVRYDDGRFRDLGVRTQSNSLSLPSALSLSLYIYIYTYTNVNVYIYIYI